MIVRYIYKYECTTYSLQFLLSEDAVIGIGSHYHTNVGDLICVAFWILDSNRSVLAFEFVPALGTHQSRRMKKIDSIITLLVLVLQRTLFSSLSVQSISTYLLTTQQSVVSTQYCSSVCSSTTRVRRLLPSFVVLSRRLQCSAVNAKRTSRVGPKLCAPHTRSYCYCIAVPLVLRTQYPFPL